METNLIPSNHPIPSNHILPDGTRLNLILASDITRYGSCEGCYFTHIGSNGHQFCMYNNTTAARQCMALTTSFIYVKP